MDRERVMKALAELHTELDGSEQASPAARAALAELRERVQLALAEREAGEAETAGKERTTGLQDALLEFEAEHPQLTGAINQVAAALANLGI